MITITLTIEIKRYSPPLKKAYKVIELDGNTYISKFARVSNETESLSVAPGFQCLGIAMLESRYISQYNHRLAIEEARYLSQYYRTLPNSKE